LEKVCYGALKNLELLKEVPVSTDEAPEAKSMTKGTIFDGAVQSAPKIIN
jgi:hypothetical protein